QNVNDLLWSSSSLIKPGLNNVTIYPDTASDFLQQNSTFRIEAYYGNYSSFYTVSRVLAVNDSIPFADPMLIYPNYSGSEPYVGWHVKEKGSYLYSYRYLPNGINFTLTRDLGPQAKENYIYMTTSINFTYLANLNAVYSYNYSGDCSILNLSAGISNFSFANFSGVLLSFENGYENYWIGYSKLVNSTYFRMINRTDMLVLTNQNIISFRSILENLNKYNWSYEDPMFSFVIGTSGKVANVTGQFYNTSLSLLGGANTVTVSSQQYPSDQSNFQSNLMVDARW
ncbi:hypothetical protein B1B_10520, partial [mine drainage metagenome]